MSTCIVSQNQPIYQALIDKTNSYPADKPYQANAYKKATEIVATYNKNIYNQYAGSFWFESKPAGIGYKIETFIHNFIKANPKPVDMRAAAASAAGVTLPTPTLSQAPYFGDWYQRLKPVVYTAENPRRSRRIASKPMVEYFTKEEKEEDELEEIADAIYKVCIKRDLDYCDELVTEFDEWFSTASEYQLKRFDPTISNFVSRDKVQNAKYWAEYYSTSLWRQNNQKKLTKKIMKYCEKNNIQYEDIMREKFTNWMNDPNNKKIITNTITTYYNGIYAGQVCSVGTYTHSHAYCINKWFSTLKKTIVF
jgi:hypothetical protein